MHIIPLILAIFILTACSSKTPPLDSSVNYNMDISVDLREEHRCSRISPEIEVHSPPNGVAYLNVTLNDMENRNHIHGGGTLKNSNQYGDDIIITEGALTRYYKGPCPAQGQNRYYQYVVQALDTNKQLLGTGQYTFLQE